MADDGKGGWLGPSSSDEPRCRSSLMAEAHGMVGGCDLVKAMEGALELVVDILMIGAFVATVLVRGVVVLVVDCWVVVGALVDGSVLAFFVGVLVFGGMLVVAAVDAVGVNLQTLELDELAEEV